MRTIEQLEGEIAGIREAPAEDGVVALIVRRPAVDERDVVEEAVLDVDEGLVGDSWRARGSGASGDRPPDPQAQITVMNARAASAVAGEIDRWPLAGDQLYVDFDLSVEHLPPGTRVSIGAAELEVSARPHTGCSKFSARFGKDALRFVNTTQGRALRLRGMNARVIRGGVVRVGDAVSISR
jgi:MOSC domain-containing protein YiiM